MDAGHTMLHQLLTLLDAPLDAQLLHLRISGALLHLFREHLGQVEVEGLGQYTELAEFRHRFDAWDDGHGDADRPSTLHKLEVLLVVVEDLGHCIVGSHILLLLEHLQVELQIRSLLMLFWIGSHPV